jgi:hypothetical protein
LRRVAILLGSVLAHGTKRLSGGWMLIGDGKIFLIRKVCSDRVLTSWFVTVGC